MYRYIDVCIINYIDITYRYQIMIYILETPQIFRQVASFTDCDILKG